MIALMDTIACIKTTDSPSKDPKSLFEDPAEFTEILKDQKHVNSSTGPTSQKSW